ncbi:S8 family serine peptidase [Compostimonas suwonensis]|uniref:S8 family serine peptidase n=1 Tax=Compostimonas suwonensis TaxID=1048394 RepID=UPI001FEB6909|nr:S8 family serine peptidase [Compostimonas suwonensis]
MSRTRGRGRVIRLALAGALGLAAAFAGASPAVADPVRDREYWLNDYGFTEAWNTTKGAGVTVAVIDTGVDASVPDLAGAVVGGTDVSGIGSPNGQTPVGENSDHGTLVASLLAGRGTGPGNGVIGVAPEASLLAVSVALGQSDATKSTDDQIAEAVRWSVDNGADIINMSLTRNSLQWPESWDDAFLYAFEHDVIIVAAAGNRGSGTTEVGAPATIPGVVTIAGVDRSRGASFDASSQGITISVAAPSEELVGVLPGGSYGIWEGTSGAAPLVSGLFALVRAAYPDLDAGNVINRVVATATPVGDQIPSPIYGYGLINAQAAVTAEVPSVTTNPTDALAEWIRVYRRAEAPETPSTEPPSTAVATPLPSPPPERVNAGSLLVVPPALVRDVSIPLAVLMGFLTLGTLAGIGATRHFRRVRGK